MVPVPLGCGFSVIVILDIFVVILVDFIIALSIWQLFSSSNLWFLNGFSPKKVMYPVYKMIFFQHIFNFLEIKFKYILTIP